MFPKCITKACARRGYRKNERSAISLLTKPATGRNGKTVTISRASSCALDLKLYDLKHWRRRHSGAWRNDKTRS